MNSRNESNPAPLRILQLNSMLTGGGTDDQCLKLAIGLQRLRHGVILAGPGASQFAKVIGDTGLPFVDTGSKSSKLQFIRHAVSAIRREKIQIVHGHHGRDIWPTILAAKLSRTKPKVVLTRHMAKSPSSWASRHLLLQQCDALIAVSEFTARVLREGVYEPESPEQERHSRPPLRGDCSKIQVIYGGIDTQKFRPFDALEERAKLGLSPEHFAFAVVGGYDLPRGKGQREFLKAAARIHEKISHARFLIIGRGSMAEVLRADIASLGLAGKAWLTNYATDMPAVMNAMDCLVHPQIGTEALGLVVCEANACGKPVIASDLDGIPEAFRVGNYGKLVAPENIAELAAAMEMQSTQLPLDQRAVEAMHAQVTAQFSLERAAKDVLQLYFRLLSSASETR